MTDTELFQFIDVFKGIMRVFPKRLDDLELKQASAAYFKAMRRFPLPAVAAGAEAWMQRGKFFPKPAEWIEAIPRADPQRVDIRELTSGEILEYEEAERRRYEGDPCKCSECRFAGVDHRFIRFVPDFDANGRDVKGKIGDRVVVRGHWAHGAELAGYYRAKEAFWALFRQDVKRRAMPVVDLAAVTAEVFE